MHIGDTLYIASMPAFVKEMAKVHCTLGDSGILFIVSTLKKFLCHMT